MSRAWLIGIIVVVLALYVGGYLLFRQANVEVWERDRQTYVIFSERHGVILYYVWRPATYIDGAVTGMRFHIGPHRT